jgi:guanylate kinase
VASDALADGSASGLVFVLSGPSGVGKDSVAKALRDQHFPLGYCVTATTRKPRTGEVHGVNYFFLSLEDFQRMRRDDELLEFALVHGNYYGVPTWQVREGLQAGNDLLITVDVQGAATVRQKLPDAIAIFLAPPSLEELEARMEKRSTETADERALRMANAQQEMQQRTKYDYCVVNYRDRLEETTDRVRAIILAERSRTSPRLSTL